MMRWMAVVGVVVGSVTACGGDDGGDGSGTGGSSSGGSGGASTGGASSGGSSSGGSSSGGSGGSSSGGSAGSSSGGAAGSGTGGSGTGGSGTGGSGTGGSGTGGSGTGGSGTGGAGTGGSGGGGAVSKDCNGATFVASCKLTSGGCIEYYGSYDANQIKQSCESGGQGKQSTSKCVAAGSVGACAQNVVAGKCTVTYHFSPVTTDLAKGICEGSKGTFYPP